MQNFDKVKNDQMVLEQEKIKQEETIKKEPELEISIENDVDSVHCIFISHLTISILIA